MPSKPRRPPAPGPSPPAQIGLELERPAPLDARLEALRALVPGAFVEGELSAERLLRALGLPGDPSARGERYGFTWAGRAEAFATLRQPPQGALLPVPQQSLAFDTARNVIVEGENLEVLRLMRAAYAGQVSMIFIDPPYNTGHDFIYQDDFRDPVAAYLRQTGQADAQGRPLRSDVETDGRHHSRWLSMMAPRLSLARELLAPDGALFVTIDDGELAHLRLLLDEIFGREHFVAQIAWQKRYTRSNNTDGFTSVIDHVLLYRRSEAFAPRLLPRTERDATEFRNPDEDPRGPWKPTSFLNQVTPERRPNLAYPIENPLTGEVTHATRKAWRTNREGFERLQAEGRLWWGRDGRRPVPQVKTYLSEVRQGLTPTNFWSHGYAGHTDQAHGELKALFGKKVFDTPKPSLLIRRMLEHATGPDALVLDFFAGSGATAEAVLEQNRADGGRRRYVLVQLPEPVRQGRHDTIADITRERVRRVVERLGDDADPGARGFRAFRLGEAAIPRWRARPMDAETAAREIERQREGVPAEVDALALCFELALACGLPLDAPCVEREVAGAQVFEVGDGALVVCVAERVDEAWAAAVAALGAPVAACLERAFGGDDALRLRVRARLAEAGVTLRTV
ncbi:MAG: site-specific DNA-methyltransferase [Deltaproteobacteria bacterium]|nr:site-specific DNA-methyltransferase [Deltaproteobacteria bacterium]